MRAVIIDDEVKKIAKLVSLLNEYCPTVEIAGTANTADDGIVTILQNKPELVFLDIQMPGKSGFDMLAEMGRYDFEVVFVTAFDQYAIQAIKPSALDYILKPVRPKELVMAVDKAMQRADTNTTARQITTLVEKLTHETLEHRIVLPFLKEYRYLKTDEILRCEANTAYTVFHLTNGEKLTVSKLIKEYEEILAPYGFIRCHQSHLVNGKYIKSLTKEDHVSELVMVNNDTVTVSRLKREEVKLALERK
jgi:two-component system LytT family response regulator